MRRSSAPLLLSCAPLPALALGVIAMRHASVPAGAWLANIAAAVAGLLLLTVLRNTRSPSTRRAQFALAASGIATILLPFLFRGADGVHRWLSLGGIRVHASSIAAPLLIVAVAAMIRTQFVAAVAVAALTTAILALQPDAAQAISFAAACSTFILDDRRSRLHVLSGVTLLLLLALTSFARRDPLQAVPHVEGILTLVAGNSTVRAALGCVTLLLLPLPFFVQFRRHHDRISLSLGVYVVSITLAPFWGTFPVPVMGYGVSPIMGYFIALAFAVGKGPPRNTPNQELDGGAKWNYRPS